MGAEARVAASVPHRIVFLGGERSRCRDLHGHHGSFARHRGRRNGPKDTKLARWPKPSFIQLQSPPEQIPELQSQLEEHGTNF
jgi:hypothetical protein